MPPINVGPTRPVGAVDVRIARQTGAPLETAARATVAQATVEKSLALDPGQPTVDVDRVASIRKAIEQGNYPLSPAKVADAIIAAGMLLRSAK